MQTTLPAPTLSDADSLASLSDVAPRRLRSSVECGATGLPPSTAGSGGAVLRCFDGSHQALAVGWVGTRLAVATGEVAG